MIRRALIIIVLLVGVVIGVFVIVRRAQMSRPAQLTSGSSVRLLDVTVGTNEFTTVKWWHGYVKRLLPERFRDVIPSASRSSYFEGTNSITVWLKVFPITPGSTPLWNAAQVQDQTGRLYESIGGFSSDSDGIYGIIVSTFPRRERSFNMVFYDSNSNEMGRLRVPNLVKGPFPKWHAESIPATHTNGSVSVSLKQLIRKWPRQPDRFAPVWEVKALDSSWENARVHSWSLHDATGNRSWLLIPGESPLKIRAAVHRFQPEAFLPGERLTITNLVAPADGKLLPLDITHDVAGVKVFVACLAGAGELTITNGTDREMRETDSPGSHWSSSSSDGVRKETWGSAGPFFVVELGRLPPDAEVFYKLRDENGNEIKLEQSSGVEGWPGLWTRQLRFKRQKAGERMTFDLMISQARVFEFIFDPADATAGKATPP